MWSKKTMRARLRSILSAATLVGAVWCGRAHALVLSTFNDGDEGWRNVDLPGKGVYDGVIGGPWTPESVSTGGNPGGYIRFADPSPGAFYFEAPDSFLGDQSAAYGTLLTYDQFATRSDWYSDPDVVLTGNGLTLVYKGRRNPTAQWTPFAVKLTEVGWRKDRPDGPEPTPEEFLGVLASVTCLRIRGEYGSTVFETTGLDNVALGVVLGDYDRDGDVDLADFQWFQACFNGPNRPPGQVECADADRDHDGDVDLADFQQFQACFNGPNRPSACA